MRFPSIKMTQVHKRTGVTFFAAAGASMLLSLAILFAAWFGFDTIARNGLVNVTVSAAGTKSGVLGSGIDLPSNPTANLLADASFEPYVFREVFTLEDGDSKTMVVSNDQSRAGVYGEGFFIGANVRVTVNDESGVFVKKTGTVTRYSPNQVGAFEKALVIGDIPADARLNDYATKGDVTVTVGEKGTIIKGIDTQSPVLAAADIAYDFTSIACNSNSFFVCSSDGHVLQSSDGEQWNAWETPEGMRLNAIAASETIVVAAGDRGTILVGSDGVLYSKEIGFQEDIVDIAYGNGKFVAVTSGGSILYSTNGILWSLNPVQYAAAYTQIEYADTLFALLTNDGQTLIFPDIEGEPVTSSQLPEDIVDVTVMSKSKILLLGANGRIYQSGDRGSTWEESRILPPENVSMIGAIGDEEILCASSAAHSFISRLVTEIELDSGLTEGMYQAGDLCYIDIEYATLPTSYLDLSQAAAMRGAWDFYGSGKAEQMITDGAPDDGVGVLRMTSYADAQAADSYAVLSQSIASSATYGPLQTGTFYTFSLWVRQEESSNASLKVWISGPFESIGTEFTNIGSAWKKVVFKFLLPPEITEEEAAKAIFNIGTDAPGVFFFDKAYLGLTSENEENSPGEYINSLREISPTSVRLDFLKLGAKTVITNRWAKNGDLDDALNLVLDCGTGTDPWIVIDSYMGEAELRNLMEYLAGSISTVYGKIRMDNGSPLPWSGKFTKILIEFVDRDSHFSSDVARAVYVNHMIEIIQASPYYKNVKNKLVFVDGMQYEEGMMLSGADHSASDFTCATAGNSRYEAILKALSDYATKIPRNADRPTDIPISLMRSTAFTDPGFEPTIAEWMTILLDEMGSDINASMITMDSWTTAKWSKVKASAAMIAGRTGRGEILPVTKTQIGQNESLINCYAFKNENIVTLVFVSHNATPAAISIDIPYPLGGATLIRFDTNGDIVENVTLGNSGKRFNIMPENVVLIQLNTENK